RRQLGGLHAGRPGQSPAQARPVGRSRAGDEPRVRRCGPVHLGVHIRLLDDLPAVAGFKRQWQNTGALQARTHELTFAARLIDKPGSSLTLNIVGDRTRQRITEWTLPERLYGFQQMPAAFFLGQGSDLGAMYGNHWVKKISELY